MNESAFYIMCNLRTSTGFERFAKFYIGNHRRIATTIFDKLQGQRNVDDKSIIQLDLMETVNQLPLNIQVITCSLDELAENCKIITREVFKLHNLEKNN